METKNFSTEDITKLWTAEKAEDGTCTVVGCKSEDADVTVPRLIDGAAVTGIGRRVFSWNERLTSVTLPDGAERIGECAFHECKNLGCVTLSDSIKAIGRSAFGCCVSLESILIPDGVISIGDKAFQYCYGLKDITVPGSVKSIGEGAFFNCEKLACATLCRGVTDIGDRAFLYCYNIESITVPDTVTSIGKDAFGYCKKLTIHAPAGSCAEKYAKENGIAFAEF